MLGNERDAKFILNWFYKASWREKENGPDGWRFLGSGVSRWVYLSPDGIVYKVGSHYANEADEMLSRLFRSQPPVEGWAIPEAYYFWDVSEGDRTVLSMEYVEGKPEDDNYYCGDYDYCEKKGCYHASIRQAVKVFRLKDVHTGNYLVRSDGVKVIIDFGEGQRV